MIVAGYAFAPVRISPTPTPPPAIVDGVDAIERPTPGRVQLDAQPGVITAEPPASTTGHSTTGRASWYCSPEKPTCHYAYPPGSMVAAACGKLRRAMGPDWRHTVVTVTTSQGGHVTVTLVDWCGSEDKTIDLYWEPMRRLGGTGTLDVTIEW